MNSLVANRTIYGGVLGRPEHLWVAFGDRATAFQKHWPIKSLANKLSSLTLHTWVLKCAYFTAKHSSLTISKYWVFYQPKTGLTHRSVDPETSCISELLEDFMCRELLGFLPLINVWVDILVYHLENEIVIGHVTLAAITEATVLGGVSKTLMSS